jgi:hypothetical protein
MADETDDDTMTRSAPRLSAMIARTKPTKRPLQETNEPRDDSSASKRERVEPQSSPLPPVAPGEPLQLPPVRGDASLVSLCC